MSAPPLTHHEIFSLVEPFTHAGLQVDLAGSNRAERQLRFKPVAVADTLPDGGALAATLLLDCAPGGYFTLTRVLAPEGQAIALPPAHAPLQTTVSASGDVPADLLQRVQAVPVQRHYASVGEGCTIARSYLSTRAASAAAPALVFTRGQVRLPALTLTLNVLNVRGSAGDLTLEPAPGTTLDLPEDLLAVLGWDWARLVPATGGWTTKLRLRGKPDRRTAGAEQGLDRVARHLAQVLSEPPQRFGQRHRAARWGVVLRRSIPTMTGAGLIGGAFLLPRYTSPELQGVWMALHYLPIALLALSFSLQELSRFEIPRPPPRLRQASWQQPAGRGQGA